MPESWVRDRLARSICGDIEVPIDAANSGFVDILTDDEMVEVKRASSRCNIAHALGQIKLYAAAMGFAGSLRVHAFGTADELHRCVDATLQTMFKADGVRLTQEAITESMVREWRDSQQNHALASSLLVDEHGTPLLHVRPDGMVYVSAMCTHGGVQYKDWRKAQDEMFLALARKRGIEADTLETKGRSPFSRTAHGTFLHPELVAKLASYVSIEFELECLDVINRYLSGRVTAGESTAAAAAVASAMVGGTEPPAVTLMRERAVRLQESGDAARGELARMHEASERAQREARALLERSTEDQFRTQASAVEAERIHAHDRAMWGLEREACERRIATAERSAAAEREKRVTAENALEAEKRRRDLAVEEAVRAIRKVSVE